MAIMCEAPRFLVYASQVSMTSSLLFILILLTAAGDWHSMCCRSENKTVWPCPAKGPHSVGSDGLRGSSQPCWANASLIATIAANIRSIVKQEQGTKIISLSGMDGTATFIQCPTGSGTLSNRE